MLRIPRSARLYRISRHSMPAHGHYTRRGTSPKTLATCPVFPEIPGCVRHNRQSMRTIATLLCLIGTSTLMSAAVKIEKTEYGGWPNCYRISNGEVELIVTTDVGPRIMHYGFVGG